MRPNNSWFQRVSGAMSHDAEHIEVVLVDSTEKVDIFLHPSNGIVK